jgi:hypothetical protein
MAEESDRGRHPESAGKNAQLDPAAAKAAPVCLQCYRTAATIAAPPRAVAAGGLITGAPDKGDRQCHFRAICDRPADLAPWRNW